MKLFNYDAKHDCVHGALDLGELNNKEQELLANIISFLRDQGITNRYRSLVVAQGYLTEEDGESHINFIG